MSEMKLVSYGVDTLILNIRYADHNGQPFKRELAEELAQLLDELQGDARKNEMAMVSPWSFFNVALFVEPHGAGRQWRWLLTSRLLNVAVSRGKFNDIIAQVRFSSEYLWSQEWCGDLLSEGVYPKVVQEILGHSEISMAMDTYSHVFPTIQKDVVSRLDNLF